MDRLDWQQISEERLLAAQSLLASQNWPTAYYVAGYAVECGLKSCVLVRLSGSPGLIFYPPKNKFAEESWTHRIDNLVRLAGLKTQLDADTAANQALRDNWTDAMGWNESSRYEMKSQADAQRLYNAIMNAADGVMQWIRARW